VSHPAEEALLARVREAAGGAAAALAASRRHIDDLNVYPVPDGDTGTNLSKTVQSVVDALAGQAPAPSAAVARTVRHAALMGARGNSGIILSQVLRGACDHLAGASEVDGAMAAAALRAASDAAYRAVRQPVEGTMLTVIRAMAESAEDAAKPGRSRDDVLDAALAGGREAVQRTPQLLAILREAGVVDAGGAGLVEILRGFIAGMRREPLEIPAEAAEPVAAESAHAGSSRYRYCTSFVIEGDGLDGARLERELAPMGDSLLVVGDGETWKVHVHTDDPGGAIRVGTAAGSVSAVELADMQVQTAKRSRRLDGDGQERAVTDVVCVLAGDGNRAIARSLGVREIVEGGQSLNPSTQELLEAVARCRAPQVVILPNNPNVVATAERAAELADRPVRVVETRSIAAGLAAAVEYRPDRDAAANARAMAEAAARVRTGAVTTAVRDATADGVEIHKGDTLALLDGTVVGSSGDPREALRLLLDRLLDGGGEILTVLRGADPDGTAGSLDPMLAAVARAHPEVEIEVRDGGQPHYPVVLAVE
jgi:DAK2 domain fusion protein YloV